MRGNSLAPALIGSAALHAALFGLALWKFPTQTREVLNAIPVQIVSDMPAMAPAPAAPPTMDESLEPEPEPAPEEALPEPTPPTPEPPKPTPPKPEPKPTPKPKPEKPTPKPAPQKEAALDLDALTKSLTPKKKPRTSQSPTPTKGSSNAGAAEADMGPAMNALQSKLMRLWSPNCGVEGAEDVVITVRFNLSETGRVIRGPTWIDKRSDGVWQAAATRAVSAVKRGEPYDDLPEPFYRDAIEVAFDGRTACR